MTLIVSYEYAKPILSLVFFLFHYIEVPHLLLVSGAPFLIRGSPLSVVSPYVPLVVISEYNYV